ncbi:MAG: hypothetical protein K0S24_5042 [Sphingobacterium sp.]|nr:hypothetical protein [Sphingobacterium sp.]
MTIAVSMPIRRQKKRDEMNKHPKPTSSISLKYKAFDHTCENKI